MTTSDYEAELEALKGVLGALGGLTDKQAQLWVVQTACARLQLDGFASQQVSSPVKPPATTATSTVAGSSAVQGGAGLGSAKDFMKAKAPRSDVERMTCLAYYLTHAQNEPHFKTAALTKLNSDAKGQRFGNPSMAVSNATRQNGFLAPAGKGNKQLTALGEDVVAALPDYEKVAGVIAGAKSHRRKKRGTNGKKKRSAA